MCADQDFMVMNSGVDACPYRTFFLIGKAITTVYKTSV